MATRPENICPPEIIAKEYKYDSQLTPYSIQHKKYYNQDEAVKYTNSTRIIEIQEQLTERCVELLNIPDDEEQLILDIGCGSGLSGAQLSEHGHTWVGIDISRDMLNVAADRESEGDLFEMDMGQGFNFRHGVFDSAVSVSALQWLCVASKKSYNPMARLKKFFQSLYNSLRAGGRAVLQFYPDGPQQLEMITTAAMKCGFGGGVIVDYPNSAKAKKLYLVITAGGDSSEQNIVMQNGLNEENEDEAKFHGAQKQKQIHKAKKPKVKSKEWIQQKKERQRAQGRDVRPDSKYTGRKRSGMSKYLK